MDGRKQGNSLSMIHNDEIWKDHVNRELLGQKHWPQKWGFLSDIYKELSPACKKERTSTKDEESTENSEKKNFPKTDAQLIGWKACAAKKVGVSEHRARGKCNILKEFNWPQEGH